MPEPAGAALVVAFVVGVTPGKWARVWAERMPRHPLTLLPTDDALSALDAGTAQVALTRLPVDTERFNAIPLYTEQPVVVAPKGHAIEALDTLTVEDLSGETVLDGEWGPTIELVAANLGVTVVPQSVARALSRRDVISRPLMDAPTTQVALVWLIDGTTDLVDEFIGIVRGRTARSSRGR
ncbi:MAG: LysR family transcriptional regulator substrate-binding protein [Rhodoglobus sp.]